MQRIQCSGNEYMKSVSRMERSGLVCVADCAPEIVYMSECKGRIDRIEGLSRITIKVCGSDDKAFITASGIRVHRMGLLDPIVLAKIKQDRVLDDEYKLLLRYTSSGMECTYTLKTGIESPQI